jgi:hypothetical protein
MVDELCAVVVSQSRQEPKRREGPDRRMRNALPLFSSSAIAANLAVIPLVLILPYGFIFWISYVLTCINE